MIREKPPMTIKNRNLSFAPDITARHNLNSACAYTLHVLYVIERWLTKKTEQRGRRVQVKHTCTGKREEVNGVGKKSNAQSYWPFRIPGETSDRVWRLFSEYRPFCAETDFDQNIKRLGQDRIRYKIFYTKKRFRVFRRRWIIASVMFRNIST